MTDGWTPSARAAREAGQLAKLDVRRSRVTRLRVEERLTATELARRCGVDVSSVVALETGYDSPLGMYDWTDPAQRLADYFGVSLAWLWPRHAPKAPRLYAPEPPTPEALAIAAQERASVPALVAGLRDSEQRVLTMRFGLDGCEEHTYREVGVAISRSAARVQQIERHAFRNLRRAIRGTVVASIYR